MTVKKRACCALLADYVYNDHVYNDHHMTMFAFVFDRLALSFFPIIHYRSHFFGLLPW